MGDFGFGDVGQAQAAAAANAAADAAQGGMDTGGGDFGFGSVGQQQVAADVAAQVAADAVSGFGGYQASQAQIDAEAAMGLEPFGGYGNVGFMGPDGTQGMEVILPAITAITAPQPICPEGYEYDANLQACRKITMSPMDQLQYIQPATAMTPRYAMMGLLDQAPMGLLEAGFGAPADFTAKNLAFRRQSASVPTYFSDPRSYEGYTLI